MTNNKYDVVIMGGGAAGLRAAIAAAEANPKGKIAIVSKVYPMRSHTVSAEGGSAAVLREYDNFDFHCRDTIFGADFLADQDVVEAFVHEAPQEIIRLDHWGCPWSREEDGRIRSRSFGGMSVNRTVHAADKTGFHILHTLFQTSMKYENIDRFDECFATSIMVDDNRAVGITYINIYSGEIEAIQAKATVICSGGGGKVYPFTTNAAIKTGDGMALAYRAGVPLKDMEFVQYHPTGLPGTGILMTEACRGEGGYLVNKHGHRYLEDYGLGPATSEPKPKKMELGPRDILSRCHMNEHFKGNTFTGDYGHYVHLDMRHLGQEKIDSRLPFVRSLARNYIGIDPVKDPIPVRPAVHYMMGGIDTNIDAKTVLDGLYAAGEVACVSLNGANRLGSNSLTECLVFGARAGTNAVEYAASQKFGQVSDLLKDEQKRIKNLTAPKKSAKEKVAHLRNELRDSMEEGIGIYRDDAGMTKTCETIAKIRKRFDDVEVPDNSAEFNTGLLSLIELDYMIDVAAAVAHSALNRKESRGSHTRPDFEKRDDVNFLRHSMATKQKGDTPKIGYSDVTITKWQPEERKY